MPEFVERSRSSRPPAALPAHMPNVEAGNTVSNQWFSFAGESETGEWRSCRQYACRDRKPPSTVRTSILTSSPSDQFSM
jgi:hypothetical protein